MKRASTGVLIALFAAFSGLNAVAAPSNASASGNTGNSAVAQGAGQTPPADFGTPPSGQIPILFNDHHVYSKPDVLKQGRVLAALVKGGTLLIPLRSMFEQMGATVSYDAGSKTATVSKPGAASPSDRRQTGSRHQRRIASAGRRADDLSGQHPRAGPRHFGRHGRVRAVGSGSARRRRSLYSGDSAAHPGSDDGADPGSDDAPTPTPTPKPAYKDLFLAGDYIISPKVYNEFSPGNTGNSSFAARGAFEFDAFEHPLDDRRHLRAVSVSAQL